MNTKHQTISLKTLALLCLTGILLAGAALTTFAAPRSWAGNGSTPSWLDPLNWNEGALTSGDFLSFISPVTKPANSNDAPGRVVGSLTFGPGTSGYGLGGASLFITNGISNSSSSALNTISNSISFATPSAVGLVQATQTVLNAVASGSGALVFKGFLTNSAPSGAAAGTNVLVFGGTGDFGVSNVISGVAGLIKTGAGNLTLGAANTYGGNTVAGAMVDTLLLGGTIRAGANNVIPNGNGKGNLNITNATYDLNGTTQQSVDGLNGDSTAIVNNSSTVSNSTLSIGNGGSNSFWGGNITDPNWASGGIITVSNNNGGSTFFTAANAYHGMTRVQGGTLILTNNGTVLNSTNIYIANGRTLRIDNNSVGGNLTDRISDNALVILDNGVLGFYHNAAAGVNYSETLGTVIFTNNQSRIDLNQAAAGQTCTLTINNVVRYGSGWGYFSGTGLGLDTRSRIIFNNPGALTNVAMQLTPSGVPLGIIPWAYNGSDDLQRWVSTNNLNSPAILVANDYALNIPETQWDITNNVRLGYGQTLTGSRTVSSLNLGASAVALTRAGALPLDLGGSSLRIASGALMFGGDSTGIFQITNGTLTAGISAGTPAELMIYTRNTGTALPLNVGYSAPYIGSEIAASITDNGGGAVTVTKALGNPLVLSGNNTYSGGTTVANGGGTLIIGNGGTTGSVGTGDITNYSGEIYLNRSDDLPFTNVLRGTGGNFRKFNANNVIMTADSGSYAGTVYAYPGLTPDTGSLILAGGGRLTNAPITVRRSTFVVSNSVSANNTDRLGDGKAFTLEAGTFIYTNDGGGATNYSESVGGLTANYGFNTVVAAPPQANYRSRLTFSSWTRNNNSTLNIVAPGLGTNVTTGSATNLVVFTTAPGQQFGTFNPASVICGTEFAKYTTNISLVVTSVAPVLDTDFNSIGDAAGEANWRATNNLKLTSSAATTASRTVNTLNLTNGPTLTQAPNTYLTVSNAGILASGDANATITGGILNGGVAELIFHVMISTNNGNTLTVNSVITNSAYANLDLTKSGPGTLVLGGANVYSGLTRIGGGVLSVSQIGDAGSSSGLGTNIASGTYLRGGTLRYTGSGLATTARPFDVQGSGGTIEINDPNGNLTINAAVAGNSGGNYADLTKAGPGTLTLGGTTDNNSLHAIVQAGTLVLNKTVSGKALAGVSYVAPGATIKYGNTTYGDQILDSKNWGVLNMNGTLDLAGASDAIVWMTGSGNITNSASTPSFLTNGVGVASVNTLNITDGANSGGGTITLVKSGANILALSGNNTYSGKTLVQNGTLAIDDDSRLGAVPTTYVADQLTLGYIGTSGGFGTLLAARGNFSIAANRGITLATNGTLEAAYGATMTINSIITGTNNLTKTGPGTVVLANSGNNWTNGLTISGGTLKMGASGVIPYGFGIANVTVNGGSMGIGTASIQNFGTLDLNGFDTSVNGLTVNVTTPGVGGVVLNNAANTTNTLSVGYADVSTTLNGGLMDNNNSLGGVLALKKVGTNITILGNYTNTYSGGTILASGNLSINNDANLGAVPATPTTNITFMGGTLRNAASTTFPVVHANRIVNLTTSGGFLSSGFNTSPLVINGKITGPGFLGIAYESSTNVIANPLNDYTGNTIVGTNGYTHFYNNVARLRLGASEVIPNGPGKGNLLITNTSFVDLGGFTETVNGLSGFGTAVAGSVDNTSGNGNLIVGDADTTSVFDGVLKNTFGTLSLTKIGAGKLTLTSTNSYAGGTTNAGGILNINADTALGTAAPLVFSGNSALQEAANLTLSGSRSITINSGVTATNDDQGFNVAINGPISGAGSLTKVGSGTLSLYGANTYSGSTVVADGTLLITSSHQGGGAVAVNDGKVLTISFSGPEQTVPMTSLTLGTASGAALNFTGWAADPATASVWATNLVVNGTVTINLSGQFVAGAAIPLIRYTGAIGGSGFAGLQLGNLPRGVTATLQDNPGEVSLLITDASGISWTGALSPIWDVANTANWLFSGSGTMYQEPPGDAVTFGNGAIAYTVILSNNVAPLQIQFTNTDSPYTLTGTGMVTGAGLIIQNSPFTNTLSTTNTFTGGTLIKDGVLKMGISNALGAPSGPYLASISSGAALDLNGNFMESVTTKAVLINGRRGTDGAIVNSGAALTSHGVGSVTLGSDAALGSVNNYDVVGRLDGAGHHLDKIGGNRIGIRTGPVVNLNGITVSNGTLEVFVDLGGAPVEVQTNASLYLNGVVGGVVSNSTLTMHSGTFSVSGTASGWSGPVILQDGTNAFNPTIGNLSLFGPISGTSPLTKNGGNSLLLYNGANSWSGPTTNSSGVLYAYASGALPVDVVNNAIVAFVPSNGATIVYGKTLTGFGNLATASSALGTTIFTGTNLCSGGLQVNGGTMIITNGGYTTNALIVGYTNTVGSTLIIGAGGTVSATNLIVGLDTTNVTRLTALAGSTFTVGKGANSLFRVGGRTGPNVNNCSAFVNLAAMSNFTANVGQFMVGTDNSSGGTGNYDGTVFLATNNTITAANYVYLGFSTVVGGSPLTNTMVFGSGTNLLITPLAIVAHYKTSGYMYMNSGGNLTLSNTVAPYKTALLIATNNGTGNTTTGLVDMASGTISARLNSLAIGKKVNGGGTGNTRGTLNVGTNAANDIQVDNVELGYLDNATNANMLGIGTLNFGGGVMAISSNLTMATLIAYPAVVTNGYSAGNLNLTGGTVTLGGDVVVGVGYSSLILDGATLDLRPEGRPTNGLIGTALSPLSTNRFLSGTLRNIGELNGGTPLVKTGTGTLILDGTNTYTGLTLVSNGTLLVHGIINTNALVTYAGATLGGNGVIHGPVTIQNGATLSPGASIGILTVSNSLTIANGAVTVMEINKTGNVLTNDLARAATITYGGTLNLALSGSALQSGDAIKLFDASSAYVGAFTNITPATPGTGLVWNTNQLAVNGTLMVQGIPVITQDPVSQTSGTHLTAIFTAGAQGYPAPDYRWYFDTNTQVAGATSLTLTLNNLQLSQAGYYQLVASNLYGSATSAPAQLVITNTVTGPSVLVITPSPTNYVEVGYPVGFLATVSGTTPDIRWYLNSNFNTMVFMGAAYTNPVAQCVNNGEYYSVTASNELGVITSDAPVYVAVTDTNRPAFVTDLVQTTNTTGAGSNFTLSVTMAASCHAPVYTWYYNTNTVVTNGLFDVPNNINASLTLTNLQVSDSGKYIVTVTNSNGATNSMEVTLVVTNHSSVALGLLITPSPTNTVDAGNTAGFTATVTGGTSPIDFYWYKLPSLTVPVGTGNNFTSAVVTCLSEGDAYQVVASNIVGLVTSAVAYVEVRDLNVPAFTPAIVTTNVTLLQGTNFSVAVGVAASCNLATYRWYVNATNLLASQTTPTLSLASLKLNDAGIYTLIVSNNNGLSQIGTAAVVTVTYVVENPMVLTLGTTFQTTVTAELNRAYWLEARDSLTEGTWHLIIGVTNVTGPQVLQDVQATNGFRFYRIGSAPAP
ncbi:MAG: autotransporter-associated beta strand repeat-containing protein [Verrucomicrobiota bacterium]